MKLSRNPAVGKEKRDRTKNYKAKPKKKTTPGRRLGLGRSVKTVVDGLKKNKIWAKGDV